MLFLQVRSIECRRVQIAEAMKGTSCTFAVRAVNRKIALKKNAFRKGECCGSGAGPCVCSV